MKRRCIIKPQESQSVNAATSRRDEKLPDPKREATRILNNLKAVVQEIEDCDDATYVKYIPDTLLDDLLLGVRELSYNLNN